MAVPTIEEVLQSVDKLIWKDEQKSILRRSQGLWHVLIFLRHCRLTEATSRVCFFQNATEFAKACFDVNGIYLPISSEGRYVYYEPCASQGKTPADFFRHKEGPRQTYLNRIYTGLSGGGPKKPEYFESSESSFPTTISLKDNWVQKFREKEDNRYILDNCTSEFLTFLFRFGVPDKDGITSTMCQYAEDGNELILRNDIKFLDIPESKSQLKECVTDFLGLSEIEFSQLFPSFNSADAPLASGIKSVDFEDLRAKLKAFYADEEPSGINHPVEEQYTALSESVYDLSSKGSLCSPEIIPKNILLKGVPGTGKSHLIDKIISDYLDLDSNDENVLRINVHAATRNSYLMQGISVGILNDNVHYGEKKGAVLDHLIKAIKHPNQPFVLVLEEIQENSLNELIGDLIYLIEPNKRTIVADYSDKLAGSRDDKELLKRLSSNPGVYSVSLPSLVSNEDPLQLVFPSNLFMFCTTNYRDDKKIIEDNLLRRFDVIDLFPLTDDSVVFKSEEVKDFLSSVNKAIMTSLSELEVHPDRFLVGHATFMEVDDSSKMMRALKRMIDEFKEIRGLDFETVVQILNKSTFASIPFLSDEDKKEILEASDYFVLISNIQAKSGYKFLA